MLNRFYYVQLGQLQIVTYTPEFVQQYEILIVYMILLIDGVAIHDTLFEDLKVTENST
jgi:hypothetical protein